MQLDWNTFPADDFEAAKKLALEFYHSIGGVSCPALNGEEVSFNRKGIDHILYKAARSHQQIIERLSYLRYVVEMLTDPDAKTDFRFVKEKTYLKKHGQHQLCDVEAKYWSFRKIVHATLVVKVLVRQVENGKKHFYSIMKYEGPE